MLSVYCNGFWTGFLEGTDPVSVGFFLELLSKTFETPIVVVHDPQEADILLESLFGTSLLRIRTWKYTVFFSGESRICPNYQEYDCVLWGETTKDNVVCCPEFITYLYSTRLLEPLEQISIKHALVPLPQPRICVIISNPGGQTRNHFLDVLDRYFQVDYVGRYRTNMTPLAAPYTSEEFRNFVKNYRCIVSMENSRGGDYVTEKITHGLLSGVVPIYWGAKNVGKYFNTERFIHLEEWDEEYISMVINHVMAVMNDDEYYKNMVSQPCFVDIEGKPSHSLYRTLDHIATDMRVVFLRKEN